MKSGLPVLLGSAAMVASAVWFDAHSNEVADAASAWMTPTATPTPADSMIGTTLFPTNDHEERARGSSDSKVAFGTTNESK